MQPIEEHIEVSRCEKTAVTIIDNKLFRVPLSGRGPFYTRGEIAEYLGIPPNVATKWINTNKLLGEKQLKALRNRKRPAGFIQKTGNEVKTTRDIIQSEISRIGMELINSGEKPSTEEILNRAIESCLKQHPNWTREYFFSCLYYLHEYNPKARKKPDRPWVGRIKKEQRRKYITSRV